MPRPCRTLGRLAVATVVTACLAGNSSAAEPSQQDLAAASKSGGTTHRGRPQGHARGGQAGSDDPLAIDPMALNEVRVLETIKEGNTVYAAKG